MYAAQFVANVYKANRPGRKPALQQANRLNGAIRRANEVCKHESQEECVAAWREVDLELKRLVQDEFMAA